MLACAISLAEGQTPQDSQPLTPLEQRMATAIDVHLADDELLLEEIVDINSGTMHFAGVEAVQDVFAPRFEALGFQVKWVPMQSQTGRAGDLVAEHLCPQGEGRCGKRMLLIGHMDTAFEPSSPFQKYAVVPGTDGKVATGPGVADMKGRAGHHAGLASVIRGIPNERSQFWGGALPGHAHQQARLPPLACEVLWGFDPQRPRKIP
jgi:glutamate carboxypeptidase